MRAVLLDAVRQGRVLVEPAKANEAAKPGNGPGAPSKDAERLKLMRSLLTKHDGDQTRARAEYINTLSTADTDWAHKMGLVSRKHAGETWHDLYPNLDLIDD